MRHEQPPSSAQVRSLRYKDDATRICATAKSASRDRINSPRFHERVAPSPLATPPVTDKGETFGSFFPFAEATDAARRLCGHSVRAATQLPEYRQQQEAGRSRLPTDERVARPGLNTGTLTGTAPLILSAPFTFSRRRRSHRSSRDVARSLAALSARRPGLVRCTPQTRNFFPNFREVDYCAAPDLDFRRPPPTPQPVSSLTVRLQRTSERGEKGSLRMPRTPLARCHPDAQTEHTQAQNAPPRSGKACPRLSESIRRRRRRAPAAWTAWRRTSPTN